jgi:hypothetical protein
MSAASIPYALGSCKSGSGWTVTLAALELAGTGIPVFPCAATKVPVSPHGFKDATTDAGTLRRLWQEYPGELIGVCTGRASGFDVLDLDAKHPEAKAWWKDNRRRSPKTRTHRTRSGGLHLLLAHNDAVRCSASKIARGVDTHAAGGYVIWWPATGLPIISDAPRAPWPIWLRSEFCPPRPSLSVVRVPNHNFIGKLVRLVAGATEGERNSLTYWAACRAGEMVASGLLSADTAMAVIAEAATRAGLPRAEAERTARSGIRAAGGYPHE